MLQELRRLSHHFLNIKNTPYRRYFIETAKLSHRMSILVGARGIGKTTTLVQLLLQYVGGDRFDPKILYIQADHFAMGKMALYEIAEAFVMEGGRWIVFDEIHKYPEWSKELKSIYDTFPELTIFASGSSALEIHKGSHDLTRRAAVYSMQGMSFREFLSLSHEMILPVHSLETICKNHLVLVPPMLELLAQKDLKIIPEFRAFLELGYYPYFKELEDGSVYQLTLEQNVHATIESDLVAIYPRLTGISVQKIQKLLRFIASSVPFVPNWNNIKETLEIGDLRTLRTYFSHLEDAGLIRLLPRATKKLHQVASTGKVYLENPNLLFAIAPERPEKGTLRETFFLNALAQKHKVSLPLEGDFLVDETFLFEVGGKGKGFGQIQGREQSYLALDDMEMGVGAKIPLWLFGFLY